MRADAADNREQLLCTARQLLAAHGSEASLRSIAAGAGVGIATLYRHFPTREDLLAAVAEGFFADARALVDEALAEWDDDPGRAWTGLIRGVAGLRPGAMLPRLAESSGPGGATLMPELRATAAAHLEPVLDRAREAGLLRSDIDPMVLMLGIGALTRPLPESLEAQNPDLPERLLSVFLRGLRPDC